VFLLSGEAKESCLGKSCRRLFDGWQAVVGLPPFSERTQGSSTFIANRTIPAPQADVLMFRRGYATGRNPELVGTEYPGKQQDPIVWILAHDS